MLQGEWSWVNEAKKGAKQAKWGYVSSNPGDELTIQIRHRKSSGAGDRRQSSSALESS
jgi:hypothetical protein